ncbi:MAG: ligase-associated DNA damage response exonuclease [Hyphomicrobiaceae bacterium]|nr:ligase-associated DNA damage response exonuclease [Hyphomicrobiaceae bacterium]
MTDPAPPAPPPSGHAVSRWLHPLPAGLYCAAGDFYIDPRLPVSRAVITHGHADHARAGHGAVLATAETIAIMKVRYGPGSAGSFEALACGERKRIGGVEVRLEPAGHILGSAQVVMEHRGMRAVVTGDYKRAADPTCAPFAPVACDVLVTEATFGLPVFRHEPAAKEAARLAASIRDQPERTHLLGVYSLGKCQRMIALLRAQGYDAPIHLHGALVALTELYQTLGIDLGDVRPVSGGGAAGKRGLREPLAGALVMCPPSALADRWSQRFADPVTVFASGWMRVRGRIRQRGVELPLVVSDHADWPELIATIEESEAEEVWVTHGREDALVRQLTLMGRTGRALALVGFEDEAE